ncbi:MAG: FAD-dependent oxidoreductase [Candidatus Hydrogenedentes bacterium]|nr:FAD-dependent oxidoreductase [Candidatus Hydrogenedentota bacterium]
MSNVTTQSLTCDVFVAGGGPAGIACALAAARNGARTILCQDRPVLGGNASSEVRMHIVGADCSGGRGVELATEAREGGIVEEIRLENAVRNPQRSASMMDLILYEKCRAESNLTLLLNTTVAGARTENGRIVEVQAERLSTETRFTIAAQVFVDCTGDGRLGAEAGAPFREGREAHDAFNESLAQPAPDQFRLGSTLLFQARKHDKPMPFVAPAFARKFTEEDLALRPHATAVDDYGHEYGYWWVEWGGTLDTIKDNEAIRDELLAIQMGVWDHIKNGGDHGAANWALEWVGFVPGKRESRRFVGLRTLTENDVMQSHAFDDAIAYGGWPIDTHPPQGIDAKDVPPCDQHPVPNLYDIPLRCCVSRDIENLMFAGRNMSATHIAFASTRVMATCFVVGQGVGTAAAHASETKQTPHRLLDEPKAIRAIQQRLLRDDCYLIGRINEDESDLARRARVTASSEQPDGPAINALSGQTRSVHGKGGAPTNRARSGSHRWMSDPAAGIPAWLMLEWEKPVSVREIRLVFDTGLHRVLTLSHADAYTARMLWGQPQPETVCDYTIEARAGGQWRALDDVRGNYQRLRVHRLTEPQSIDALRITVHRTNGLDHARIMEVRVRES